MPNVIACRIASYGDFQERGWSHLPEIGVHNVEIPAPAPAEVDAVRQKLSDHGLQATSLQGRCDMSEAGAPDQMKPQLEACTALGARICFLSAKAGETDRQVVYDRLRTIGDIARGLGVTVAIETHPDLITNGDVARETMDAVKHPNVKVNFDTGNIYFYNQGRTAHEELPKIMDEVAAVHLKDTNGGYKEWHFCELGQGVVDFPKVMAMFAERGFAGPFTMELEGIEGVTYDEPARLKYIADSVAYLRSIHAFD